VLAVACGGIEQVSAAFARAASGSHMNDYMRRYQTGGPGYYARGLGLLQPLPVALGLLAAALAVPWAWPLRPAWSTTRARTALQSLGGFMLAFVAIALAYPQKNMRFLSPLYAPIALLAAALVWAAIATLRARLPATAYRIGVAVIAAALVAAAVADHQRFVEYFITRGIPDLATPWLTQLR
jgi:hypothetical protein